MRRSPWILVDSAWAEQLGVARTAGVYRIARRDLVRRFAVGQTEGHGIGASISALGLTERPPSPRGGEQRDVA